MNVKAAAAVPRVLVGGQPTALYSHVGYSSAVDFATVMRTRTWTTPGPYWPGLLVLAVALLPLRGRWFRLWRLAMAAVGVILLLVVRTPHSASYRALPEPVMATLQRIEALSAGTEAWAAAHGRWPTAEEWHRLFGWPVGLDGRQIGYTTSPPPVRRARHDEPKVFPYAIWSGPLGSVEGEPFLWLDVRRFGADGLYGTSDDSQCLWFLGPAWCNQASFPHARAPRDPQVKLPGWPAKLKESAQ